MLWKRKNDKDLILLCNSWPKSGTHLLLNMASIILKNKGEWYHDDAVKANPQNKELLFEILDSRIKKHGSNFAMKGHLGYSTYLKDYLSENNVKIFFIIRDPRDVICSTIRWVMDLRKNWPAHSFFNNLEKEEQLSYAINGMPDVSPFNNRDSFVLWEKPIKERYSLITPWVDCEEVCLLKYEELSGNHGQEFFQKSIEKISEFLDLEKKVSNNLFDNVIDRKSATFHSGNSGDWINEFTEKNIKEFIDSGGEDLVKQFNYKPSV